MKLTKPVDPRGQMNINPDYDVIAIVGNGNTWSPDGEEYREFPVWDEATTDVPYHRPDVG